MNFLRWLAVIMFVIALARPQIPEGETTVSSSGVDIILAVDLSNSMRAEDFTLEGSRVNRLEIARDVMRKFIRQRPDDRLGLVAFAGMAYLAVPLTLDHDFLLANLERLELGMIEDGTAIGDGLTTCINRLKDLEAKSKIVILITDGQETVNNIPPLTAAEVAKAVGVKVYTIGVGTRGKAPYPHINIFGKVQYIMGEVNIDEKTLTEIAQLTNGKYYRADNTEKFFEIYQEIDKLEKTETKIRRYSRYQELFVYFAACGMVFLALEILLSQTIFRTIP
jgi:Ca-activated chloride channel family protein